VPDGFEIVSAVPDPATYLALRAAGGLSGYPLETAIAGLAGGWHSVLVMKKDGAPVGMGRIVGDGGCFFQITDIVVRPEHQGNGLGKAIMQALMDELAARAPKGAYVSLIADVPANRLYEQFGFVETAPRSIGMARRV